MISVDTLVEVRLIKEDDFLKIKETLTRVGVASERTKTLYQSCHILHKRGQYYITHFKEMFALDGKPTSLDAEDVQRRNTIVQLLSDWGLLVVVDPLQIQDRAPMRLVKVIPHKEKDHWQLVAKYRIGKKV
jgi:hypothetical protein